VLVARQRNRLVDNLINSYRLSVNVNPIPVGVSTKSILRILRGGGVVGILADQNSRGKGVFVNFMGRPASTPRGPAAIALRMKIPALMVFDIRCGSRHRILFEELDIPTDLRDDEEGIILFTQAYTEVLERYIRHYPDHWFWMHRRWKTRPGSADKI
jgi:KDO2-lipid IV(A) lauroyltransferase